LFVCVAVGSSIANNDFREVLPAILIPLIMIVFGYAIMKWLVFDLVDEVWDDGTELIVRNRGHERRIALANVINVNYQGMVNPPRITLFLRQPTEFGTEISFLTPFCFFPFQTPTIAKDLIARVDAARLKARR